MNIRPFLSSGLEMDVETYALLGGTEIVDGSLKLAVAGPENYTTHKSFNSNETKALLNSFSVNTAHELAGHSVYALYKDRKLIDVLKRG